MSLIGKSIISNYTKFAKVKGLKVKKTLEGRLIFDELGFEFKKSLTEILQVWHDDIRINYSEIKEVRPLNYGPIHTIMIVKTKDDKEYRFGIYNRSEVMEFLKGKMED